MLLIVNDASLLIDVLGIDLTDSFFELGFEMHVPDLVLSEITDGNVGKLKPYLNSNKLHLGEFSSDDLLKIQGLFFEYPRLSLPDCSCLYLAESVSGVLLTGDGYLRTIATKRGVVVHGVLWVFDQLLADGVIEQETAFNKLGKLMCLNSRLPKKECEKRLKSWRGQPLFSQ